MATQPRVQITPAQQVMTPETKLLLHLITPLLTITTLTITTMGTFITLIMMAHMEEHTTGILTGGTLIGS